MPTASVGSLNIARPRPNPYKPSMQTGGSLQTGIGKLPVDGRIEVRAPGPKHGGLGSGLIGDFIGDTDHHGGDDQAVYAFAREDLDDWERRLHRELPSGFFGENLTTVGLDLNECRIGEQWLVGEDGLELEVTCPRIPCATFRGWMGEPGWLKTFTRNARPGAYLKVVTPGTVGAGDSITISRPRDHKVTISLAFRASTTQRELIPELLAAGDDLPDGLRRLVADRG